MLVHGIICDDKQQYEVVHALRPLEVSLAEAVSKIAHQHTVENGWLAKDNGARVEYLRSCQEQFGKMVLVEGDLRTRMLRTYHNIYGSSIAGEALFHSKSYSHYLRKGYKRPGRKNNANNQEKKEYRVHDTEEVKEEVDGPDEVVRVCHQSTRSRKIRTKKTQAVAHIAIW